MRLDKADVQVLDPDGLPDRAILGNVRSDGYAFGDRPTAKRTNRAPHDERRYEASWGVSHTRLRQFTQPCVRHLHVRNVSLATDSMNSPPP